MLVEWVSSLEVVWVLQRLVGRKTPERLPGQLRQVVRVLQHAWGTSASADYLSLRSGPLSSGKLLVLSTRIPAS
jgi:hypothetical protein